MLKNLTIRKKFILLYVNMTVFTFFLLIPSYIMMAQLCAKLLPEYAEEGARILSGFAIGYPATIAVYLGVTIFIGRKLAATIAFPLQGLNKAAQRISHGDVDASPEYEARDEVGTLAETFRAMVAGMQRQADALVCIAEGDYTGSIEVRSDKDAVNMAISKILDNSNTLISEIRSAAEQVSSGAAQIATGAQTLASGSTEQAASISQLNESLESVRLMAVDNSRLSEETSEETKQARALMQVSLDHMRQMTEAMQMINESSKSIAAVIGVIDNIAFQTNILALNASVEAAHAGQHGKGFAVVAEEVRTLASRSAAAAKETAELIEKSIKNVEIGTAITQKAGESLGEIAVIAASNGEKMEQLSNASGRQMDRITEISEGVGQISTVVQMNTATAEESAAASQQLSAQSNLLQNEVARFVLRDQLGSSGRNPMIEQPAMRQEPVYVPSLPRTAPPQPRAQASRQPQHEEPEAQAEAASQNYGEMGKY